MDAPDWRVRALQSAFSVHIADCISGFDYIFKVDDCIYKLMFSTTADDRTTAPSLGVTGFPYRALHVKHVIVSPRNRGHGGEHAKLAASGLAPTRTSPSGEGCACL